MRKKNGMATKPVLSSSKAAANKGGVGNADADIPVDATDSINKDLEDANLLPNEALDPSKDPALLEKLIPRNL